jgi:hypothetical protein
MRVVALLALLWPALAVADQTIQVTMNGRSYDVDVPQNWTATPEAGSGVSLGPPPGTAPTVKVIVAGFEQPKGGGDAKEMLSRLITGTKAEHADLEQADPDPRKFAGEDGVLATVGWTDAGTKRFIVFVVSTSAHTVYVFRAEGSNDDIMSVLKELNTIINGVRPAAAAASNQRSSWARELALPPPPRGGRLADDPMLGLRVDATPDWGSAVELTSYLFERRWGTDRRLMVGVWTSDVSFSGNGDAYLTEVAKRHGLSWEWDRFARHQTLVVKKPPTVAGAGDILEYHVMRGLGRPLIFQFRLDGARWGTPEARDALEARAQLETFTTVADVGNAGRKVGVAGGVASVPAEAGMWTFLDYGPGAQALLSGPGTLRGKVGVMTTARVGNFSCDDQSVPRQRQAQVGRKAAREYACPDDRSAQLIYGVPSGAQTVFIVLSWPPGKRPADADVRRLLDVVKVR